MTDEANAKKWRWGSPHSVEAMPKKNEWVPQCTVIKWASVCEAATLKKVGTEAIRTREDRKK
jgi:hypothetical protein